MSYTQPTLSGYNSNPPPDDGSTGASNTVSWATHKNKLADPLKTFMQAVDTNVAAAFAEYTNTADPTLGDALVGIKRTDANAVANTLHAWMEYQERNIFEFIPINLHSSILDGTNSTDLTTYIGYAVTAVSASGGVIKFPRGEYRMNLTMTTNHVTFLGESFTLSQGASNDVAFVAHNAANPVITLGDGTTAVEGFNMERITMHGDSNTATQGLLIQSADRCYFSRFSVVGFSTYNVKLVSGATGQISYIFFDIFNFSNSNGYALDIEYGATYTSAVYFSNGTISDKSGGRAVYLDQSNIFMTNVWIQATNGAGVYILNLGKIWCNGVTIDSDTSSDTLVELDADGKWFDYLLGDVSVDGLVKFLDTTTVSLSGTRGNVPYRATLSYPFISGTLAFGDTNDANNTGQLYAQTERIYSFNSQLYIEAPTRIVTNCDMRVPTATTVDFTDSQATVGSAGGASALPATPTGYIKIKVGGASFVVPYYAAS